MYKKELGRFTTTDPLQASASTIRPQSWNRYSYSYNNPLRFIDPSGMIVGDFLDQKGNIIGHDENGDDGKFYLVTDDKEVETIKNNDKAGENTKLNTVTSSIELPPMDVRDAIDRAVDRSNKKNTSTDVGDKLGRHHEEGLVAKTVPNGPSIIVDMKPGKFASLTNENTKSASIDYNVPADPTKTMPTDPTFIVHIHPAGPLPPMTTGINTTTYKAEGPRMFDQPPSGTDISKATNPKTTYIVIGAGNRTVYFYGSSGIKGTMPYDKFRKLGKK